MKPYTVIGFYADSRQRFCETIEADSADAAEKQLLDQKSDPDLFICGVIEGDHAAKDTEHLVRNLHGDSL